MRPSSRSSRSIATRGPTSSPWRGRLYERRDETRAAPRRRLAGPGRFCSSVMLLSLNPQAVLEHRLAEWSVIVNKDDGGTCALPLFKGLDVSTRVPAGKEEVRCADRRPQSIEPPRVAGVGRPAWRAITHAIPTRGRSAGPSTSLAKSRISSRSTASCPFCRST